MEDRGIFSTLFDFSFTQFIAVRLVRIIYPILLALSAIGALGVMASLVAFGDGFFGKVGMLIVGAIAGALTFLLAALQSRVLMELLIVAFRGVDYLRQINEKTR